MLSTRLRIAHALRAVHTTLKESGGSSSSGVGGGKLKRSDSNLSF